MRTPASTVRNEFQKVRAKWRSIRFGEFLALAGILLANVWLGLEWAAYTGELTSLHTFYILVALFVFLCFFSCLMVTFITLLLDLEERTVATTLEQSCPSMRDRIHTLIFLKESRNHRIRDLFGPRIESQVAHVIREEPIPVKLGINRLITGWVLCLVLIPGVIAVQWTYNPFGKLKDEKPNPVDNSQQPQSTFDLKPQNITDKRTPPPASTWGEIRVIAPGHDVKLTKVDVLPLQIEMSTSGAITEPKWVTSINGGPELTHPLDAAREPNYAVYQPIMYLDELEVDDWDVVSYYASAKNGTTVYTSKIYFVDIRPFRRDILKSHSGPAGGRTPAGGGGKGQKQVDQLSALIKEQTRIIQQTQLHQTTTFPKDVLRQQDTDTLVKAEGDLKEASDHFYAALVSRKNTNVTSILDHLVKAEKKMVTATDGLKADLSEAAKQDELGSLAELVACRKNLVVQLKKSGDGDDGNGDDEDDSIVTAQDSANKMAQVSEVQNKNKSDLDRLHQLVVAQEALVASKAAAAEIKTNEQNVLTDTKQLMRDNSTLFLGSEQEAVQTQDDLQKAITGMDDGTGAPFIQAAAKDLEGLEKAAKDNDQKQQLAQAYQLNQILQKNASKLREEAAKPGTLSADDVHKLADTSLRAAEALKQMNDSGVFGDHNEPLTEALSDANLEKLIQALDRLRLASQTQNGQKHDAPTPSPTH